MEDTEAKADTMEHTVGDTMGEPTAVTIEDTTARVITEVITAVTIGDITHFFGELRYGVGLIILAGPMPTMRDGLTWDGLTTHRTHQEWLRNLRPTTHRSSNNSNPITGTTAIIRKDTIRT